MKNQLIKLGTISEDFDESNCFFKGEDVRTYFYSNFKYQPSSITNPIIWEDKNTIPEYVPDIIDKGDKVVTKEIA